MGSLRVHFEGKNSGNILCHRVRSDPSPISLTHTHIYIICMCIHVEHKTYNFEINCGSRSRGPLAVRLRSCHLSLGRALGARFAAVQPPCLRCTHGTRYGASHGTPRGIRSAFRHLWRPDRSGEEDCIAGCGSRSRFQASAAPEEKM